ncbi:MAG: tetratricopeptide repeat protein [Acidobacteria bacterium]|nr:tetratricopeptide repeat protein [Acidobacteriota bacterium]
MLELRGETAADLQRALSAHDYVHAERLLLAEIDRDPHSARAWRLLAYVGSVYFASRDYLNAAVAWKKAQAIAPLDAKLRFSLAMAYIRLGRPDWARSELQDLARVNATTALYPYWLGRLDYDQHFYNPAIKNFQHAIELDPGMARAFDNLGLCYFYENQNDLAVKNFEKAIELDRGSGHPSPWPYLNLGITEQFLNHAVKAEKNLREATRIDPSLAKAHFQLGTVLEDKGETKSALAELKEAARLDLSYPEPHMAMARLYHKLGQEDAAREEVKKYRDLRPSSNQ